MPKKVTVIPNAVNIENFNIGEEADLQLAEDLGLNNKILLGFIGSFYAYEGLNILLQALPKMLAQNQDIRILLVGGGPQESKLKTLAIQLGIENKVVFTGRVPHDQVQRYYNLIDILVYPRLKMRLTDLVTPLKPLEAMAQGVLVLSTNVGYVPTLLNERRGFLVDVNISAPKLSRKIKEIAMLDYKEKSKILNNARLFVSKNHNLSQSAKVFRNFIL